MKISASNENLIKPLKPEQRKTDLRVVFKAMQYII